MPTLHQTCPHDHHGEPHKLHVVTAISNPWRYRSRYELYQNFAKRVHDAGAVLWTVETAFGRRPYEVTSCDNPQHIQLRTTHELWLKENMLNLAIQRLPQSWKYVAWVDADVDFVRHDWVTETLNLLQHYHVVQMFSSALDLDPQEQPFHKHTGFVYSYANGLGGNRSYSNWHPGFAWAIRREAFDDLGGLIDFAVLGSADRHMATALIGRVEQTLHKELTPDYTSRLIQWQQRALKYVQRNIGFMPGTVLHHWHGKKADRRYRSRWEILVRNKFDPKCDLKRDWQGLWQLTDRSYKLRDDIRNYFSSRNEDSIDFDPSLTG